MIIMYLSICIISITKATFLNLRIVLPGTLVDTLVSEQPAVKSVRKLYPKKSG